MERSNTLIEHNWLCGDHHHGNTGLTRITNPASRSQGVAGKASSPEMIRKAKQNRCPLARCLKSACLIFRQIKSCSQQAGVSDAYQMSVCKLLFEWLVFL